MEAERITEFSCGHVIPPENLLAVCVDRGPAQVELNFSYQHRMKEELIDELARVLCNVCTVVPGGVVVFFPSYDYEVRFLLMFRMKSCLFTCPGAPSVP